VVLCVASDYQVRSAGAEKVAGPDSDGEHEYIPNKIDWKEIREEASVPRAPEYVHPGCTGAIVIIRGYDDIELAVAVEVGHPRSTPVPSPDKTGDRIAERAVATTGPNGHHVNKIVEADLVGDVVAGEVGQQRELRRPHDSWRGLRVVDAVPHVTERETVFERLEARPADGVALIGSPSSSPRF
jgi:hypothetical protein